MANFKEVISKVDNASAAFDGVITKTERKIFDSAVELMKKLEIDSTGHIKTTTANLKLLSDIKTRLQQIAQKDKAYLQGVKDLAKAFDAIYNAQAQFYATNFAQKTMSDKAKAKYEAMKRVAVTTTIDGLTGAGLTSNVLDPLGKTLLKAVTSGAKYSDLIEDLRRQLVSVDNETQSDLAKYAKTYAITALTQYAGQNNKLFTDDLGAEWFRYVGSEIETTREFCHHLTTKEYVHISEIPEIIHGHIEYGGKVHHCKLNPKTQLPQGMIDGTTPDNFQVNVGGWNCRHQLVPIAKEAVPKDIRAKFDKQTQEEIAKQKAEEEKQKQIAELKSKLQKYQSWKDTDADAADIGKAILDGDTAALQSYLDKLHDLENQLSQLDLLANPESAMQDFTFAELKAVQDAVAKTMADWLQKYKYSDILQNPAHAVAKLEYEIYALQQNKKYATWQVAQKAYQKQLTIAQREVQKEALKTQLKGFQSFKTKSSIYKNLLGDLELAISNSKIDDAIKIKEQIELKQQELLAKNTSDEKLIKSVLKHKPKSTNNEPQDKHIATHPMRGNEAIEQIKRSTGITDDALAQRFFDAVYGFSKGWDYEIRHVQCGENVKSIQNPPHKLADMVRKAIDIEDFIAKSPKWKGGITYRGMSLSPEEVKALRTELQAGEGNMLGSASWSTDKSVAQTFSEFHINEKSPKFGDTKTERVILLTHEQACATSIMHLSYYTSESEVIASKMSRYKLIAEQKYGKYTIFKVAPSIQAR